ncbi:hypothetical protein [uncultured Clostridium sp.]|jgi:type IV pilus assembly protein PilO|uniref:hypothetical protein n=1 Tax=uncultured Clostridium sp. TaxID=59620 RepID=UPI002619B922|nr:hypothetical protein [uncultured Clostridium sp.]
MKISEKERVMLGFLLIGAIGVGYYYLGYKPHVDRIDSKTLELSTLETEYTKKQSEIAAIKKNEKDIKLLEFSIDDANDKIYPDIWQSKLIKELSDLRVKAGIDVNFNYSEVTYAPISEYFTSKEEEQIMANSLDSLIEEYNTKMPEDKKIEYKKENGQDKKEDKKPKEEKKEEESTINVQQMKVSGSFKGKYENVVKFIKLIEDYKYLVAIPDISMAPSGNGEVSGTLSMEFYSAPRLNGEFGDYYDFKAEGTSGKDNPFDDAYTNIDSVENEDSEAVSMNVILKPFNSDMPSISVGRPNDPTGRTKLLNDDNEIEEVIIEFYQEGDKYLVKYKMGSEVYPKAGGIDFVPKGNIKIGVTSEKRSSGEDRVAVKLKVKNTTDKKVEVEINGDDKANPRVKIETDGNVQYTSR